MPQKKSDHGWFLHKVAEAQRRIETGSGCKSVVNRKIRKSVEKDRERATFPVRIHWRSEETSGVCQDIVMEHCEVGVNDSQVLVAL